MERILGLDTGTNSLGWAIVNKHDDGHYELLDKGVDIFQEGVNREKGLESSKAAARTEKRALRVRYYRIRLRKIELLHILSENHLCPPLSREELSLWRHKKIYPKNELFMKWQATDDRTGKNPYHDRYVCLTQKLDLTNLLNRYMLGRALYHINQRRGFKSNRKDLTKEDKEAGTVKEGINELSQEIKAAGCSYLGEYFYHLYEKGEKIRKHYTAREEHYLKEFMAICERQELDSKLIGKLEHAIFYQRPLKSQKGLVGHCVFEPKKTKCPVSHPLFEEFRMLSFINSIKIQTPSDTVMRPLNDEERSKIKPLFYRKSKRNFDFADIAKKLAGKNKYAYYKGGNAPYLFNYFKDSNVSGCPVNASLRDLFGEDWLNNVKEVYDRVEGKTDLQIINDIWSALFFYTDNDKLAEFGKRHLQLSDDDAKKFGAIPLDDGYAALSLKAITKILPYLRSGMIYSHAAFMGNLEEVLPSGIWDDSVRREEVIQELIRTISSYSRHSDDRTLEQCLKDHLSVKYGVSDERLEKLYHPSMIEMYPKVPLDENKLGSPRNNALRNPMAMRSLFQMRHTINYLLKEGKIDRNTTIHIEFARELNDANKRIALAQFTRDNQKVHDNCRKKIIELYKDATGQTIEPTETDILKYQLWEEQNHICLYTGKQIGITDFIGPDPSYDIEHTIPRSKGGDSTRMNLTLCSSKFNRDVKKTMLPTELPDHELILHRIENWKKKYEDLDSQIRKIRTWSGMEKEQKGKKIQRRHLLQLQRDYWYGKFHRFEMTDVPEGFCRRQGVDISVISKYGRLYLKSFFDRVFIVKGLATSDFRKIWGIQDIYSKKERVNHVHHCIDAVVIACMGPGEYSKLAAYYHDEENHEWYGMSKPHVDLPWPSFVTDMKDIQNEIFVVHHTNDNMAKQGRRVRRKDGTMSVPCDSARVQLHLDTYYGAIEQDGNVKYVVRKALDANFKESDIKNIVDDTVREKVLDAVKRLGFKEAMASTIWMNEDKHIPIRKVRCLVPSVTRPLSIRQHRDRSEKEYKRTYHVANNSNYAMAIYVGRDQRGKEKRAMEIVNNIDTAKYFKASFDRVAFGDTFIPLKKNDLPLAFVLRKGTMVLLYENDSDEVRECTHEELVRRLYKVTGIATMVIHGNTYGVIELTYHEEARPSTEVKGKNGAYKAGEELRPKIIMLHTQFKGIIEGVDFILSDTGEIKIK